MTGEEQVRAALEKAFGQPLTEYQWSMITSLGYERAVLAKERTVEEVAEELRQLKAVAAMRPKAADKVVEPDATVEAALTWDQMERLVLGRVLADGEPGGPQPATAAGGTAERRYNGSHKRARRRRQTLVAGFVALAVAVVAVALADPWSGEVTTSTAPESPGATVSPADSTPGSVLAWPVDVFTRLSTTTSSTTTSTTLAPPEPDFVAHLSGAESLPPVETIATGVLSLTVAPDGESVQYVFAVTNALDLTMAALCQGEAGSNGERVFTFRDDQPIKGVFSGVVVKGTITADMLFGPLEGKTMADFLALAADGLLYVKAGTAANPWGEIRGQIEPVG